MSPTRGEFVLPSDRPTQLEAHTLQRLADGRTMDQIANEEHLSRSAIVMRVRRMARRLQLGAETTTHLVVIALRRRWIT